jgi:hypothetical protein
MKRQSSGEQAFEAARGSLTVVELGAQSTALEGLAANGDAHALVVQQAKETPLELALRVAKCAREMLSCGTPLRMATIVASEDTSEEMFQARCHVAQTLIRAMSAPDFGCLVFCAPDTLSNEGRHELLALAGTLANQLSRQTMEVSVRFLSPPSGVRATRPQPPKRQEVEVA